MSESDCRLCGEQLTRLFVDLGMSPLCQNVIRQKQLNAMEAFFPLRVMICDRCLLVQLGEYVAPDEIFDDYAYFSSYSDSWVEHARKYSEMAIERFGLENSSFVVELASNDGYLLQHFSGKGYRVLGIEPAERVADAAIEKGIPTEKKFFGVETAREVRDSHSGADLIVGNNVLAHVPDLNDFIEGMKVLLNEGGAITMEFPHLMQLIEQNQFDTIYHEHFSYFSFHSVCQAFSRHELEIFDVEQLPSHGGSLRIFACHADEAERRMCDRVADLHATESRKGLDTLDGYGDFRPKVEKVKRDLLDFLITQKAAGKHIAGYGAPGKGNTLLNYCGIREDFLDYTVDRNPHKQGTFTPGTHIPILDPAMLKETKPDFVLILPWNLKKEIVTQHSYVREWGGRFVVPIPSLEVVDFD